MEPKSIEKPNRRNRVRNVSAYFMILVFMVLFFHGYFLRGHSPLVPVVPNDEWWPADDMVFTVYTTYISGRMTLEGMQYWDPYTAMGHNYYNFSNYFRPTNAVGAWLVKALHADVFQVFGMLHFLLLFLSVSCFYLHLQENLRHSRRWALFGSLLYFLSYHVTYFAITVIYLGIMIFVPLLLYATHRFFERPTAGRAVLYTVTLSAPVFFGVANICISFFFMAGLLALVHLNKHRGTHALKKMLALTAVCFTAALALNSIVWGQLFLQMMHSVLMEKGHAYMNPYLIDPFLYPVAILGKILFPHFLFEPFPPVEALMSRLPSFLSRGFSELPYSMGLPLLLMLIGVFAAVRKKKIQFHHLWLFVVFGIGVVLYAFEATGIKLPVLVSSMNLVKYMALLLGAPLLALVLLDGLWETLDKWPAWIAKPWVRRALMVLLLCHAGVLLLYVVLWSGLVRDLVFNSAEWVQAKLPVPLLRDPVHLHALINAMYVWPVDRTFLFRKNFFVTAAYMVFSVSALWVLWKARNGFSRNTKVAFLILVTVVYGWFTFIHWGGIYMRKEVFAADYFAPQKNELLARKLIEKEQFQYRVMYFENICDMMDRFPDDPSYKRIFNNEKRRQFNPENRIRKDCPYSVLYFAKQYLLRAAALKLPVPDGFLFLPSKEKSRFYLDDTLFWKTEAAHGMVTWVRTPYNPQVSRLLNVRYVLSPWPLPGFRLVNKTNEYWAYLYEFDDAVPVVRAVSNGPVRARVTSFEYLPDEMRIRATSNGNAMVRLNMTLDSYWRATVNGRVTPIQPVDGIFAGVRIPPGKSDIIIRYGFSPFRFAF